MKNSKWQKILSVILSLAIVFNITMVPVFADESDAEPEKKAEAVGGEGKYVKDVYIAYAESEAEARNWLRENGWESLNGNADFNAGKASFFDDNKIQDQNVAAVMGIRRTDNAREAITDLAVMNMKGGYSFPDYQAILKEKKAEINEFIDTFIPVLEEYRKNYNEKGGTLGKKRAELAHDLLNRFYDGGEDDPYALNDTGKPLGDLFLDKVMQEGNEKGGDLQQIILESSGASVMTIETCLALAADAEETTWLERLEKLSEGELSENLGKYVPEAKGQDVAPSAVKKFLKQRFGDQAKILAGQWSAINDKIVWFEEYSEKNDLWQHDGESDKDYLKRTAEYVSSLHEETDGIITEEQQKYIKTSSLYNDLYSTTYEGEWGETLGDFFNPAEGQNYADDVNSFLPIAAALSAGQRSAVELVTLETLILIGAGTEETVGALFTDFEDVFDDAEDISIYSGINRGIYRGGVALTSTALMEKNQGNGDPFADMWSFSGIYNITTYATAVIGVMIMGIGIRQIRYVSGEIKELTENVEYYSERKATYTKQFKESLGTYEEVGTKYEGSWEASGYNKDAIDFELNEGARNLSEKTEQLERAQEDLAYYKKISTQGRIIMGIGGALLVAAAAAKGYQLYKYYKTDFTQIPMYIVDEADIVSYEKDDEGNETKLIQFDQFVYYAAVGCNRQEVGEIGDWQSGVDKYKEWGCGDAADLNADMGQEWLALYQVKSERKGYPILADSLKLQYGSKAMPKGCSKALHMFTYENAQDIGDTAYAFNNDKKGIYFFWDTDEEAYAKDAASTFAGGTAAVSGGIGLLIGIIGTVIVMRKKKEQE